MSKIGVLYICTGKYAAFWDGFYASAKKNLCVDSQLIFYVFTDNEELLNLHVDDVRFIYKKSEPWPMPTLMRFSTFLSRKEKYLEVDYLLFCNANLIIEQPITTAEILSDKPYFATIHPGHVGKDPQKFPYEKNSNSLAYINNAAPYYVCGGFNGGRRDDFVKMCELLSRNIDKDLENNIIAVWHDETHFNKFYSERLNLFNVLPAKYCQPQGWPAKDDPIITVLNKEFVIGVSNKGAFYSIRYYLSKLYRRIRSILIT